MANNFKSKLKENCGPEDFGIPKIWEERVENYVNWRLSLSAPEQSEAVMYQYRNIVEGEPKTEWEEVKPRNPHMETVQDSINELLAYRYKGRPSYEVRALYAAPQPTTPEPVNQALIGQLKEFARVFPELNMSNFTDDDVADLNGWGIEVVTAIDAAEQAPQPELTDEQIRVIVYDTRYNGIYDTVRACIAAAQKGKA